MNRLISKTTPRPYPYSTYSHFPIPSNATDYRNPSKWHVSTYTSWQTLTNRSFSNRHLSVASESYIASLPSMDAVASFFMREDQDPVFSDKSSILFMGFAQWFTDAFLRLDFIDVRKNTSNHEIDLCQIYGLDEKTTSILRSKENGKIKTQIINGIEYLPYLFDINGNVKEEFRGLPYVQDVKILPMIYREIWEDPARRNKFYVTGMERGNSTITHSSFNTIFVRAHNKICDELRKSYTWDDEQLFQVTRNILNVILIRIVVEDYINHINPTHFKFITDTSFAEQKRWYRPNWISIEFNLLYRWHSLIPESVDIRNTQYSFKDDFGLNNKVIEQVSIGNIFEDLSKQKAGKIVINNTPNFMWEAELKAIFISRVSKLRSYNEYRVHYGLKKLTNMNQLTKNEAHLAKLNELYKDKIDDVELTVGLFAEETRDVLGDLLINMIAAEAFSHALTNPLLSKYVYNSKTFSERGLQLIDQINSLDKLLAFTEGSSYNINFDYNEALKKA